MNPILNYPMIISPAQNFKIQWHMNFLYKKESMIIIFLRQSSGKQQIMSKRKIKACIFSVKYVSVFLNALDGIYQWAILCYFFVTGAKILEIHNFKEESFDLLHVFQRVQCIIGWFQGRNDMKYMHNSATLVTLW